MCSKRGPQLMDPPELLFRQIHPTWLVDDGVPGSLSFVPSRHDEDCLSVDRGACTDAAASYSFFTSDRPAGLGRKSAGVWALTVEEVHKVGCKAFSDPEPASDEAPANAAHAVIDFEGMSGNQQKKIGARLKIFAVTRGRLTP
jgi:hypothetical protein